MSQRRIKIKARTDRRGKKRYTAWVEPTTRIGYESVYRNHIKPSLGRRPIGEILPAEVGRWLNEMQQRKVGSATQKHAYRVLHMILKTAHGEGIVPSIATQGLRTLPVPKREVLIFTRARWAAFLLALDPVWAPLCQVGVATGMRSSELRALCPAQVSWAGRKIVVDRTLTPLSKPTNEGERYRFKPYPKNRHTRRIPVSEETLEVLAGQLAARHLAADSEEPLFVGPTGRPFDQKDLGKAFDAACAKASIPRRTPHHMRSTAASWMLKDTGGDVMRVKNILDHADLATTMRYLAEVEEDTEQDNVEAYEEFARRLRIAPDDGALPHLESLSVRRGASSSSS